jgi:metal-sulfur cluster biosynthetic enzyme
MVHSIEAGPHGHVRVRLLLDDPLCLYLVDILTSVQEAALRADGVRSADVEIIGDELWSPDRLTEETRAKMNRWRIAREGRTPLSLTPASSIAPE